MLNLIVISSKNIELTKEFYSLFGIIFVKEKHNQGMEHYAGIMDDLVFEIYPETIHFQAEASVRLGFKVQFLEDLKFILKTNHIDFQEIDKMIGVEDPDGRKIFIQGN